MRQYDRRQILQFSLADANTGTALSRRTASEEQTKASRQTEKPPSESPIRTRMFWTWDHSTEWVLNAGGAQTMGASNLYGRTTDVFLQDYTKLLHWCGRHGLDAVVVWGLLRDSHGGLDAAKRLCEVASKEGVRLLAGVGLNAYGGVYYEGNSSYNLQRHLAARPELFGLDTAGNKMIFNFGVCGPKLSHHACPSRKENQQFAVESLGWLFENLPQLGGVQIETGDTGVCRCGVCRKRRQYPVSGFSWEDMALMYPMAAEAIRSVSPDAWIVCETYSHPEPHTDPNRVPGFGQGKPDWADQCLARFPKNVFVQWACDNFVQPAPKLTWTEAGTVSNEHHRHIMRASMSTYWGRYRSELAIDWIGDMVRRSMAAGFDAISLFGEVSPFCSGAELNYLALENYGSAANRKADLDVFLQEVATPLLGGADHARDYLQYARLLDDRGGIPEALRQMRVRSAALTGEPARRWTWLANYLASFVYQES